MSCHACGRDNAKRAFRPRPGRRRALSAAVPSCSASLPSPRSSTSSAAGVAHREVSTPMPRLGSSVFDMPTTSAAAVEHVAPTPYVLDPGPQPTARSPPQAPSAALSAAFHSVSDYSNTSTATTAVTPRRPRPLPDPPLPAPADSCSARTRGHLYLHLHPYPLGARCSGAQERDAPPPTYSAHELPAVPAPTVPVPAALVPVPVPAPVRDPYSRAPSGGVHGYSVRRSCEDTIRVCAASRCSADTFAI